MAYLFVYMLYNPNQWWMHESVLGYIRRPSYLCVLFLVTGIILHLRRTTWSFSSIEINFYIFLCVCWLVSLIFGIGIDSESKNYLIKITKIFIFIFLFLRVVNSPQHYKLIIWAFISGALFISYNAHVGLDILSDGRLDQLGGIDFHEANGTAAFVSMAMILTATRMIRQPLLIKIPYIIAIAYMLDTIILTQSRAVFLGIFVATPYVLLRPPLEYRKQILLCVALGAILFFTLAHDQLLERLSTIKEEGTQVLAEGRHERLTRVDFWRAANRMFIDHPLGVGVKNFDNLTQEYDQRLFFMDAHNTYVLCYTEIGILGFVIFISIVGQSLFTLTRLRQVESRSFLRKEADLHAFALTTIFIVYLTGYMMTHSNLYSEILWILLAMPIVLQNSLSKAQKAVKVSTE